jgi:hypothetical protein
MAAEHESGIFPSRFLTGGNSYMYGSSTESEATARTRWQLTNASGNLLLIGDTEEILMQPRKINA